MNRVKGISILKNTSSFPFSPLLYSGALNLVDIDANSSGEILMSSTIFDHRGHKEFLSQDTSPLPRGCFVHPRHLV